MTTTSAEGLIPETTVRAAVLADGVRVTYQRAGSGPAVLLLRPSSDAPASDDGLIAALATRFRVLVPSLPESGAAPPRAALARGLLDGLGLLRVQLVADEALAADALWLALTEPERVGGVVVMLRGGPDPLYAGGLPPERLAHAGQPLLLVRRAAGDASDGAAAEPAGAMLGFLAAAARGESDWRP